MFRHSLAVLFVCIAFLASGCSSSTSAPQSKDQATEVTIKVKASKRDLQQGLRGIPSYSEPGTVKPENLKGTCIFADGFVAFVNSQIVPGENEKGVPENLRGGERYFLFQCTDGLVQLSRKEGGMAIDGREGFLVKELFER